MILDRIIIQNFGAYGGSQEADLSPKKNKPVLLFGGMNGGGKTTLLDAIQLALYGNKAKLSNRGRKSYHDYLTECIHRGTPSDQLSGVSLIFRRIIDGQTINFEVQRLWKLVEGKIKEQLDVFCDGEYDAIYTEHWDETIEAYLPVSVSNLFFFDGEQIKELAEGKSAATILGSAIRSLLGLDLVDRLETDLRVFERRKKSEELDNKAKQELKVAEAELAEIDLKQCALAEEEGQFNNELGRLEKAARIAEKTFKKEGGDLFLQRQKIESELSSLESERETLKNRLRELAAGPLPLAMLRPLLEETQQQAEKESETKNSARLVENLSERDTSTLAILKRAKVSEAALKKVEGELGKDRSSRAKLAKQPLILDAGDQLAPQIKHLLSSVLPEATKQRDQLLDNLQQTEEKIVRQEGKLTRIPTEDSIALAQKNLEQTRQEYHVKLADLESLQLKIKALNRHREDIERRIEKLSDGDQNARLAEDGRLRMLKHSEKVRNTLEKFRNKVISRHVSNMEALMLESFQLLLRKEHLVKNLKINSETFEVTLFDQSNAPLPFERLSAGERQLLATSMLWGLARASGRTIPTVIDTPLGRLDSTHRSHLVQRYFPHASHQVILLSTDEEIIGSYHKTLSKFVAKEQLLSHDEKTGKTEIQEGYFATYETTR